MPGFVRLFVCLLCLFGFLNFLVLFSFCFGEREVKLKGRKGPDQGKL